MKNKLHSSKETASHCECHLNISGLERERGGLKISLGEFTKQSAEMEGEREHCFSFRLVDSIKGTRRIKQAQRTGTENRRHKFTWGEAMCCCTIEWTVCRVNRMQWKVSLVEKREWSGGGGSGAGGAGGAGGRWGWVGGEWEGKVTQSILNSADGRLLTGFLVSLFLSRLTRFTMHLQLLEECHSEWRVNVASTFSLAPPQFTRKSRFIL